MNVKIFSVFFLITIIAGVQCDIKGFIDDPDNCFGIYNTSDDHIRSSNYENLSKDEKRNLGCALGCIYKGFSRKEGKTLHKYLLDYFGKADADDKLVLDIDGMIQKMHTCTDVGDDECKYAECLDLYSQPWKSCMDYLKKSLSNE